MKIQQVMSCLYLTCYTAEIVSRVAAKMEQNNTSYLVVIDDISDTYKRIVPGK